MSLNIADNFSYLGAKPLDSRLVFQTVSDMVAISETSIYDGILSYCEDTNKYYTYNSSNSVDADLGKWREFNSGSGNAMPVAPKEYKCTIKEVGSGYQVGDILETDDPDVFVKVVTVNDADGSVLQVEVDAAATASNTANGQDAEISVEPIMMVGWGDTWNKLKESSVSGDSELTEDILSNLAVGGISTNYLLKEGTSLTDFVKRLVTKEVDPMISITGQGSGLNLKGSTVTSPEIKLNITSPGTGTIDSIHFMRDGVVESSETYSATKTTYTYTTNDISTDTKYSAKVVYTESDGVTKNQVVASVDYIFVNYSYFGTCQGVPTESDIQTMASTLKNSKSYTGTIDVTDSRIVYAYPYTLGALSSIKDANNFEYLTGSYTHVDNVQINGERYHIYYLTDPMTALRFKQIYS